MATLRIPSAHLDLVEQARKNYGCFERYADEQEYGCCAALNLSASCEQEALEVLKKMLERHAQSASEGQTDEESFYAIQNAKIVREAEKYYRQMFQGGEMTWNIRDTHMVDCLQDLIRHHGPETKVVIWVILLEMSDELEEERWSILGA